MDVRRWSQADELLIKAARLHRTAPAENEMDTRVRLKGGYPVLSMFDA